MPAKKQLLKEKDKKFRLLFQEHPQPMLILEPGARRILEANAASARLYECPADELQGLPLDALTVPEEAPDPDREPAAPGVWRQRTRTGKVVEMETAAHDIEYGGRAASLVMLTDTSIRRRLEDQLRQAQKMEAMGMLAGGVAHDFNNLLTIITGYSQIILNGMGLADPNRHSAEQIIKAAERAAALTRQLLAFSRRQVQQHKVIDLNQFAHRHAGN
jgi:signal transduction histidine kinase